MGEECEICGYDRGVPSPSIRNLGCTTCES
jgi:hypothetical protein